MIPPEPSFPCNQLRRPRLIWRATFNQGDPRCRNQNQNPGQQNQNPGQKPGQQQGGGQKPGQQQQDPNRQGQNPNRTAASSQTRTQREQESPAERRDFSLCGIVGRIGICHRVIKPGRLSRPVPAAIKVNKGFKLPAAV